MVNRSEAWSPMGWIYSVPGTSVQMVASHKQTNLCIEEPIQSIQIIKFTDCSWCPICVSLRPLCVVLVPVRVQHKCMGTQEFVWSDCFAQSRAFDMIIFCKMTSYIRKKEKECMLFSPFFPLPNKTYLEQLAHKIWFKDKLNRPGHTTFLACCCLKTKTSGL